jgi:hypothetical protein
MSAAKGSAIQSVVEDVLRLVSEGHLSRAALEARLEAEDVELLEQKILPSQWYSLASMGRLTELLFEVEGGRRTTYLIERGRRAADRLRATGLYRQLSGDDRGWGTAIGKLLVSLGPAIYRDTVWTFEQTTGRSGTRGFELRFQVPADFPDVCRWTTSGFVEYLTNLHSGLHISSERVSPTLIVFRGDA